MRLRQLDLLRLAACLLVFGRHLDLCPESVSRTWHAITVVLERGGWIGVDLFFVLSGFLVAGLLFRESARSGGPVDLKRFLIRRGLKIYPAFYVLFVYSIVFNLIIHRPMTPGAILGEFFFVQNYAPKLQPHTWSLAVEEHFYLLLSLLFVWLVRSRPRSINSDPFRRLLPIFLSLAIACLAMRFYVNATRAFEFPTHVFQTHIRVDSLAFGVLLAYGAHRRDLLNSPAVYRLRWALAIGGLATFVPAFVFPIDQTPWLRTIGFSLLYVGAGSLLLGLLQIKVGQSAAVRFAAWLGTHSYSIYLWHMPVYGAVKRLVPHLVSPQWQWQVGAVLFVVGSFAAGVIMAKLVEFPVLRLRERFFPARIPSSAQPPPPLAAVPLGGEPAVG